MAAGARGKFYGGRVAGGPGSDDPASRSVEDGSQEAAAAAMSAGAAVRSWARAEVGSSEEMIGLLCAATESDAVE